MLGILLKIKEGIINMKLAVIIVNYNDAEETLKYVKKISEYQNIQRIVVVDNSSQMDKLNVLKSEKVVVLSSKKNGGYSYGNNFGVKYLEEQNEVYDYLVISNSDIEIEESAIDRCLSLLERDKNVGIVAPRMFNAQNKPIRRSSWKTRTFVLDVIHATRLLEVVFYKKLRKGEYSVADYQNAELEVDVISGAFFMIRYDLFKEVGMFDENVFLFYEEDILSRKIKDRNYKIVSINDVKFIHFESHSIGKSFNYYEKKKQIYKSKMYYHINYNNINFLQKLIFQILHVFRNIELLVEIPIRKILKK